MALTPGTRLGPYEIEAFLGAGGMGEVYKARDTRLDRTVAIKILAPEIASDPPFKARFEREARSISALKHPHICVLYDIGTHEGVDYLVLEHLEGETLADRQQRESRGLKLSDVLRIAIGIADALDAAHRHGFVHRDLKPGNVMLTASGPKLLDFGLAKQSGSGTAALSMLATQPGTGTAQGTIVGTLQYMAPEQIQGHPVDARTDVFALGAVLFEMVTGRKAFEAQTQASLIAKILEVDPPALSSLVPVSPPALERLVERCLAKQPDDRWQSARDVLLELRWIQEDREKRGPAETRLGPWRQWLPWAVAAAAAAAAIITASAPRSPRTDMPPVSRFDVPLPQNVGPLLQQHAPALSPDGRHLAMAAAIDGREQLLLRRLDDTAFVPLSGTDGARRPFWSPDGRWIGFFAGDKLRRMAATGGSVVTICDVDDRASSGSWGRSGDILLAMRGVIYRVPESGGTPVAITTLDRARGDKGHSSPHFLPDGRSFLLTVAGRGPEIHVGSLDSATTKLVVPNATEGVFAGPASLLFIRGQSVVGVPFDADRLEVTGSEQTIANQALGGLSAGPGTTVVFRRAGVTITQLQWLARDGRRLGAVGSSGQYHQLALSPSGKRVALQTGEISPTAMEAVHIWTIELTTRIPSLLTSASGFEVDPAWSPDERSLAFTGHRRGVYTIIRKDLFTGDEQPLADLPFFPRLDDWTPDGRFVILREGRAIRALFVSGEGGSRILHDTLGGTVDQSQVSPDGRWIAFNSNESGRWEVYVARFPDFTEKRPISNDGGVQPVWRTDGRELFYLSPRGQLMAIVIKTDRATEFGVPRALFDTVLNPSPSLGEYGVTPNGERFLVLEPAGAPPAALEFVLNWRLDPAAK